METTDNVEIKDYAEKLHEAAQKQAEKVDLDHSKVDLGDVENAFKAGSQWCCKELALAIYERAMKKQSEEERKKKDVEHPNYYQTEGGIEVIDMMRMNFGIEAVYDFCLLNAFKYVARCRKKHETPINDLKKARYYLDYIIKNKEKEQ